MGVTFSASPYVTSSLFIHRSVLSQVHSSPICWCLLEGRTLLRLHLPLMDPHGRFLGLFILPRLEDVHYSPHHSNCLLKCQAIFLVRAVLFFLCYSSTMLMSSTSTSSSCFSTSVFSSPSSHYSCFWHSLSHLMFIPLGVSSAVPHLLRMAGCMSILRPPGGFLCSCLLALVFSSHSLPSSSHSLLLVGQWRRPFTLPTATDIMWNLLRP